MDLKVIVADDEQLICGLLAKMIHWQEIGLELAGSAYDGESLLNMILESEPDIVITDINMPRLSGLEVIKRVRESGICCRFIIVSGYRQFEYAYNALKYDVEDYLLKPIDEDELNRTLEKIHREYQSNDMKNFSSSTSTLRQYFMKVLARTLKTAPLTVEELNNTYATHFGDGKYRVFFAKLDYSNISLISENATSIHTKIINTVRQKFTPLCHDLIFETTFDGVITLINYNAEDYLIREAIQESFSVIQNIASLFNDLYVTFCVSNSYDCVTDVHQARQDARDMSWSRMAYGVGKIYYMHGAPSPDTRKYVALLQDIRQRIQKSFEILDSDGFAACTRELFGLPTFFLCLHGTKEYIRHIQDDFFDLYRENLSLLENSGQIKRQLHLKLEMAATFNRYCDILTSELTALIQAIREAVEKKDTRPVRMAIQYIEENYSREIYLADIAELVNLNPVYISNLFKKQTGQNLTEYIMNYRIDIAKELLKKNDLSVKEVAYSVGYTDAHYFVKVFKKVVGAKPSEYRKIFM